MPALKKALPDVPVYIGEADAHSTGIYHYPMADLVPDLKYYGEGDTLPLGSLRSRCSPRRAIRSAA